MRFFEGNGVFSDFKITDDVTQRNEENSGLRTLKVNAG